MGKIEGTSPDQKMIVYKSFHPLFITLDLRIEKYYSHSWGTSAEIQSQLENQSKSDFHFFIFSIKVFKNLISHF